MSKSLSSIWLKNLRRLGKSQQTQGRKLLKSLIPALTKPAKPRRTPALRSAKAARPVRALKATAPKKRIGTGGIAAPRAAKSLQKKSAAAASPAAGLPGSWKKAWFLQAATALSPARRMLYWLYLPSGSAKAPRPLVVMLHGCQQTATDFAASSRMNRLAERKGFAVLYPQQSVTADSHRCWHWYKRATQQGLGDARLLAEMIGQLQSRHQLDATRTYAAGISAGAGMAAILALRHPELIAAVGLHSAPVFGTSDSALSGFKVMQQGSLLAYRESARQFAAAQPGFPGMPVMLIQGRRDAVVRRVNVDQLAEQFLILNGEQISSTAPVLRSYPARTGGRSPRHGYETISYYAGRKPRVVKCEIEALGHAWSGGEASQAFSAPEGPDSTLLMWTFFALQQRLPKKPKATQN
ncbi:MAG: PHB depolymerase family esterase [Polaromonas sp.]